MVNKIDRIIAKVINDFKFDCDDVNWCLKFYKNKIEEVRNNILSVIAHDLQSKYPFMKD